jgi:hypothetical protein
MFSQVFANMNVAQMYIRITGAASYRKQSEMNELSKAMVESMCALDLDPNLLHTYMSSCLAWVIDSGQANCESEPLDSRAYSCGTSAFFICRLKANIA